LFFFSFISDCLLSGDVQKSNFQLLVVDSFLLLFSSSNGTMDFAVPVAVNVLMTMGLDPTLATLSSYFFPPFSDCCPSQTDFAPPLLAPHYTALHYTTPVHTCTAGSVGLHCSTVPDFFFLLPPPESLLLHNHFLLCVYVCVCVCKRMETGDFCPLELCIRVLMKEGQNMN
jgi:hypothetical protein